ncbi:HAMP domain-containing sensor histidine kinase [Massilia sp. METH4]|uniref:sensor histidine kinase n=1 Tax=Massilia sp. METH4 TaxID=3123041 RepID=UPI0030CB9089
MQSSDFSSGAIPTSDLVSLFSACRDEVLESWRKRVVVEVKSAAALGNPVLVDTLPILYDNIARALASGDTRSIATSATNLAQVHGRERAIMTEYGPQDLIRELQIFREVLFAVAKTRGLYLRKQDADVIGNSIEYATRESIVGYNAAGKEETESFIANLSHDMRNPLHVASASAQFIQMATPDPQTSALAKRVVEKIREADAMLQTLLDAAVLKGRMRLKLHLGQFEMLQLAKEVGADASLNGQPVQVAGEELIGHWCEVSMKRVLENLIANAQKYGDTSKAITVAVQRVDSRMLLSVHNEGTPISPSDMPRLFNKFQRMEDVVIKGWGLGLPFVQNVVESHGGSVIVESAEGRGTTFTVSVPIDARPYVTH